MKFPLRPTHWTLEDVHEHLEFAVNLEMWTIPYYMTALYSIRSNSDPSLLLLRSVVHQEMLHAQLAANIYNATQPSRPLRLGPYLYEKDGKVPHLDFNLDPQAVKKYGQPDPQLGPLDLARMGTMCLIELPEIRRPPSAPTETEYATIGDFYDAVRTGLQQTSDAIRGGQTQIDYFGHFYNHLTTLTVTSDGAEGLQQAQLLIEAITEQGEGTKHEDGPIPEEFQNTADGYNTSWSHFRKFNAIRDGLVAGRIPELYFADPDQRNTHAQLQLVHDFGTLLRALERLFSGRGAPDFGVVMPKVGASVLNCWRTGVVPQFSER